MEFTGLLQELNQGRHLAQQLRQHLHPPPPSSSSSSYDGILLIDRILRSYENALSVLAGGRHDEIPAVAPMNAATKEGYVFKKRKVMEKWSEKVKVPSGSGSSIEPPLNDGFSWRKYGQKDILGSKYPRSYFRCSHRFAQGCLATKQVQRSDNDSTMYEIAYKGMHTCKKALHLNTTPKEEQTSLLQHSMPLKQGQKLLKQQLDPLCLTFTSDTICVKSEKLDNVDDCLLRPFCTPSPWIRPEVQDDQSELSPTFESNDMFGFDCVGDQDWDLETRFVSVPNSFTNISMGDLEECCSFDNLVELFS